MSALPAQLAVGHCRPGDQTSLPRSHNRLCSSELSKPPSPYLLKNTLCEVLSHPPSVAPSAGMCHLGHLMHRGRRNTKRGLLHHLKDRDACLHQLLCILQCWLAPEAQTKTKESHSEMLATSCISKSREHRRSKVKYPRLDPLIHSARNSAFLFK